MKITKKRINTVVQSGNWMIRTDKGGISHNGFVSEPIGEKTVCPDWKATPECGNGLHGQAREASGYNHYQGEGVRTLFVETSPERVVIDGNKIKTPWFRILLIDDFSMIDKLEFDGHLDLRGTSIEVLPEDLHIGRDLDLGGTSITVLPEGLHVGGNLYLRGTSIEVLPEGLHVGGSLDLRGTSIEVLPEGLHVDGDLYLSGTSIEVLPEDLHVGGSLYLSGTSIKKLPEGLHVGGDLDLNGASIKKLPEGLHVGGKIYKDF